MSIITYNGVTLPYANTTKFAQEAIYDPKGRVDRILTKFSISVQATVNYNYLTLLSTQLLDANGNPLTTNPADIIMNIRSLLLQPRKSLSYTFNNRNILPLIVTGNKGTVDAKNGPMPQSCEILPLTNTSYIIQYTIVTHQWENNSFDNGLIKSNQKTSPVLYNRWTESVDIDQSQYSTRTREGSFGIRSDNVQGLTVDQLREQMTGLVIPLGFLRISQHYTTSADGLSLDYRVVDKEFFRVPPESAYEAEGTYTETTTNMTAFRKGIVRVKLRGPNKQSNIGVPISNLQEFLIRSALGEVFLKFQINGIILTDNNPNLPANAVLIDTSISPDMYDNSVEVTAVAWINAQINTTKDFSLNIQRMAIGTTDSRTSNGKQPLPLPYGTANLLLQAAAYYDPNKNVQALAPLQAGNPVGGPILVQIAKNPQTESNMPTGLIPGQAGKQGE